VFFIYDHHLRGALGAIVLLHLILGWWGIRNMGIHGATADFWMDETPTLSVVGEPFVQKSGLLEASCSPPVEVLHLGQVRLPIWDTPMVGAIGDWPGHLAAAMGMSHSTIMAMHLGLSCVLIALVHRFVRLHGSAIAANAAATLLATDWVYVFLRRTLGGTEILLSASALLCLWALWSRRWGGGRHGLTALALGAGIGLATHIAFSLTAIALVTTALVMRWDKPALRPPLPSRWMPVTLALLIPLVPLLTAFVHYVVVDMQSICGSVFDWRSSIRGMNGSLLPTDSRWPITAAWLGEGLSFLRLAWGADAPAWVSPLRTLGWIVLLGGTVVAWRDTDQTPRFALARFCSVFVPTQVLLIAILAPDLHHLSVATPALMIWAGLSTEAIFGFFAPPRSLRRAIAVFIGCLPWAVGGSLSVATTDSTLATIHRPTVAADAQQALGDLVSQSGAVRVVTVAPSPTKFLSVLVPSVEFHHLNAPTGGSATMYREIIQAANGGHLLVVKPLKSAATNSPTPLVSALEKAADRDGVALVAVDHLPGGAATLFAVGSQTDQP
tara:strand:- start:1269 stop:2930 length:1662 start_codon:yes stop_codon:yes gene_type:complete